MVEQTGTAAASDGPEPTPHATLEEWIAEPERVAREAAAHPVRIDDGPDGTPLVLLSAAEFERMRLLLPTALHASALSDEEVEYMLAQTIPPGLAGFDDEVPDGWLDARR